MQNVMSFESLSSKSVSSSSKSINNGASSKSIAKENQPCKFFLSGSCRNGNACQFSHDPIHLQNIPHLSPPPRPIIINIPPNHPVFGIDVECVASGVSHNARSIAQVALVDAWCRPIFNVYVKQDLPVMSYITPLTGLTKGILDQNGLPLAEALASLRAHVPPNAILVGQNILKDVQWLQLAEGVDYHQLIDISALFRVWNVARGEYTTFSQDHCAKIWLGTPDREGHNAVEDAAISMALFNTYCSVQWDPVRLQQLQTATLTAPRIPGFSTRFPSIDNCCMGNRKKCTCGAPFL